MSLRKYTFWLFINISLILIFIGTINRIIDPFWYYQDFEISGINKVKPKMRNFERYVKPRIVAREQPNALIFGSSFSEIGFDPTNPTFTNHEKLVGYNFGIAGANWDRVQCYFDYALNKTRAKRVIIGISPGSLPRVNCKGILPEIDNFSEASLLFSMRSLSASIGTISAQKKDTPSHTKEGMYYYIRGHAGVDDQFREFYKNREQCDLKSLRKANSKSVKLDAQLPKTNKDIIIDGLRHIIRSAKETNIELRIVVYPVHALWQEMSNICGSYKNYWNALNSIVQAIEQEGGNVEIWDFNQYNDYTGESITRQKATYWQDPEHFNFEFGDFMMDAMFNENSKISFGTKLTSKNLSSVYNAYLISRDKFINSHNDFLATLDKFIQ